VRTPSREDTAAAPPGAAKVLAPIQRQRRPRLELPDARLVRHQCCRDLLIRATSGESVPVAAARPCDVAALGAVVAGGG
jgi:hypothetical protein